MTVARLRDEMDQGEFVRWYVYYGRLAQDRQLAAKAGKVVLDGDG